MMRRPPRFRLRSQGVASPEIASASLALLLVCAAGAAAQEAQEALSIEELRQMSIDDLAALEVTSVSRQPEPVSGAAAAIHVITRDDIRRSGVTSLPEALRLAPSLHVARMNSTSYAISARGFNGTDASNKLLVLIDGRTVYSPLHSGVFWDGQDVLLADVNRIEVISGPGGALWGANAVNGVINIITEPAADTRGGLVSGSWGTLDRDVSARYGFGIGDAFASRVYLKAFERGPSVTPAGEEHVDEWNRIQGGLAAEWSAGADAIGVRAELYESHITEIEDIPGVNSEFSGGHVLAQWRHTFAGGSPLEVQAYWDRTRRDQSPVLLEDVDTYDVEMQHGFSVGVHDLVWGGGFRVIDDRFANLASFVVAQEDSRRTLASFFVQDEVSLAGAFRVTGGIKLEKHTYTDFEYMPSLRLAWQASDAALVWGAVSRAVRTPSRVDRELELPGVLAPSPDLGSEILVAYELGVRGQPHEDLLLSVSTYFNRYDHLRTVELTNGALPATVQDGMGGDTYGVELSGRFAATDWWRLSGGLTLLGEDLELDPGVVDLSNMTASGNDPSHYFTLRSLVSPVPSVDLDLGLRGVGELDAPEVPGYVELDARVAWRPVDGLELSAAGFNLLDEQHPEGGPADSRFEVRRGVHAALSWSF
ncbi:MAG TPA: TonB-dependent receptor [Longimicrobiales bacterium]|nr:TonB-dependent receptor [Longimicrobiales bacterium]